jgi:hypothetical protein
MFKQPEQTSEQTSEQTCTCNVPNQTKTLHCFQCKKEWTVPKPGHEIMSDCPEHHMSIAICGPFVPSLCTGCQDEGYYFETSGGLGFVPYELKKKE